jgi:hypothetical protein
VSSTDEQNRYLQERIALFAKTWTVVSVLGVLLRVATVALAGQRAGVLNDWPFYYQLASVAVIAGPWLLVRAAPRSRSFLQVTEGAALHATAVCLALMGTSIASEINNALQRETPLPSAGEALQVSVAMLAHQYAALIVVFVMMGVLALRAALVPSTAGHTFGLGLGLGGVMLVAYAAGSTTPLPESSAIPTAIGTIAFYGMSVAISVALSHVMHGLREQVRSAQKLGQYTLEQKLGEGGMGVVYRASHAMLRRPTAVKLLPPAKVGEKALARFEREVQLTAQLTHPNTVTVFDYGRTPDGVFYYAMELLSGPNLEQLVEATGPQPPERVVHLAAGVCGALQEAHELGLIHRDIKPANILLVQRGGQRDVPKVVDFGLVKDVSADADAGVTQDGQLTGTPMYMAPEALSDPDAVDGRSDLYALGAVAYYLLTGEPVFNGNTVVEICGHHLHSKPQPLSERAAEPVDPELEALVLRCLEKDPAARPATAGELQRALRELPLSEWTGVDAEAWWQQHGEAIRDRQAAEASSVSGATVAVDLAERA